MASRSIPAPRPFDLRKTLRAMGLGSFDAAGRAWHATLMSSGPATLMLEAVAGEIRASGWGEGRDELLASVPRLLGFDDEPRSFPRTGGRLDELSTRGLGVHLGATANVHEALVPTILGQLVTTKEAKASYRALVRTLGSRAPGDQPGLFVPPAAERLAHSSYEELHTLGIERKRAQIVIEASRRARRLEEILVMDPAGARRRLQAVRGVGPWTAESVMGVAYGDRDAVPPGDHNLPHMVAWTLAGEDRASDDRMFELLEPYRPQRRRAVVLIKQSGIHAPRYGPRTPVRKHL